MLDEEKKQSQKKEDEVVNFLEFASVISIIIRREKSRWRATAHHAG